MYLFTYLYSFLFHLLQYTLVNQLIYLSIVYVAICFALFNSCSEYTCIWIYLAIYKYCVCLKCGGRVITKAVRTCDTTPLLY